IVGMRPQAGRRHDVFRREPHVKSHCLEHTRSKGWEKLMSVNRKRFRIEQAILGDAPIVMPAVEGGEIGPMHREIMAELRAIRVQMAGFGHTPAASTEQSEITREIAESHALLETYRAQ